MQSVGSGVFQEFQYFGAFDASICSYWRHRHANFQTNSSLDRVAGLLQSRPIRSSRSRRSRRMAARSRALASCAFALAVSKRCNASSLAYFFGKADDRKIVTRLNERAASKWSLDVVRDKPASTFSRRALEDDCRGGVELL